MEENTLEFRKKFIWNTVGTGLNAFNSLLFLIIATRINGTDEAGIFTLAFSTACILYSIGIYAGRIYQVTELNKKITDKDFMASRLITSSLMIMVLLLFCAIKQYTGEKLVIFLLMTIYKALEAFSDVMHGILQKNENLDMVGKSLFMKSVASIILFLAIDLITGDLITAIVAMIIAYILIMIFYDFRKISPDVDFKVNVDWKNIKNIFKKGFFIFIISFLSMYVLNAPKYSIDEYLDNNIQTIFGIIVMPATVIGLVAQFLIHPYLTKIVALYEKRDLYGFKKIISKIIVLVIAFGLVTAILGYLIGTQILGLIYGLDLGLYKIELAVIIVSATLYTIGTIYSSVLTTVRNTFSQFIIYIVVSIVAYVAANAYTLKYGIDGAIAAYFLIMLVQSLLYIVYTNIKLKKIFEIKE